MNIRARAILIIVLTNFAIIMASVFAGTLYVQDNVENFTETDMMVVADIADEFVSSELDTLRYEAQIAAESFTAGDYANWHTVLVEQYNHYEKFIGVTIMDRTGESFDAIGEIPVPRTVLENEHIQNAFNGKTSITSTVPTELGAKFYVSTPILGEPDYILICTLDGSYFSEMVSGYAIWDTGHIFIDDNEGYVLANIRDEWVENRQNFIISAQSDSQYEPIASIVEKLIAGERGIDYYSMDGVARMCAFRPISSSDEGWALGIVAPLTESPMQDVTIGLLIIAVIMVLLNIAAAIIASRFISRPFEQVAALKEEAVENSQAKSNFLARMSHEIRTPLNAVVGLSELALEDDKLGTDMEDKLEKIHSSGTMILSIVNDILDISKIESGKFEIYPTEYDTPSLLNDIMTIALVRKAEKPITLTLTIDEKLPAILYGDDLRVKQIFNNLLSNAIKFTIEGEVEWHVSFEREGESIWIISSVKDTGIGMRPEALQKLFSDYSQVDVAANRKIEGTGLGLAITKNLLDQMDGTITVESEYGKGSTFAVRFRQGFVSDTVIGKTMVDTLKSMRYRLSKKDEQKKLVRLDLSYAAVLVVDDMVTNLDVAKGMLKPYGMRIDVATSGQQAIEMIKAQDPCYDAIFMDHMMPGMDGIEATRIIREEIGTQYAQDIPIIALTANAIMGNEEMFLSKGFQAFIPKPIDMTKMNAVLRRWVRKKDREQTAANSTRTAQTADKRELEMSKDTSLPSSEPASIDGINIEKLLERFADDEEVLIDVLRSYITNTPPLLQQLTEYLAAENFTDYAITVHGIKGSSYGILADEVGSAAELLEHAAKQGDFATVRSKHTAFVESANALLARINRDIERLSS